MTSAFAVRGSVNFHPGPLGENSVIRWTAPSAGNMQSSEMPGPGFHDFSYIGKFFSNFGRQILEKDGEGK